LQIHIAQEEHKFGLTEEGLFELLSDAMLSTLKNIKIIGLMGMATFTDDQVQISNEFRNLKRIFDLAKTKFETHNVEFSELSMGMSDDYMIALEEGSTIIRVGSKIFGPRVYAND
jgi:hypothetical protein